MKEFPRNSSDSQKEFYTSPRRDVNNGQPALRVTIFSNDKYFGLFYSDGARFAVERQGREVWADWPQNYLLEDACTYLVGPVLGLVLRLRGVTCLHASAIAIDNHAIVLVGSPGAGKSTTAAALAHTGFPVLSDDVVALAHQGGCFLVQPGYPRVNLWPEAVSILFGSEEALPRITPTWGKRYFDLDRSCHSFQSKPLPLGAVYLLDVRQTGLATSLVEGMTTRDSLLTLVAHTYVNYLLDSEMLRRDFDVLGRLLATAPVRRVRPTADPAGIFGLCDLIAADARQLVASTSTASGNN